MSDDLVTESERSMVEATPSVKDLLAGMSGRTRSVWVCPDGELLSQHQEVCAQLSSAQKRQGEMLADGADVAELAAEEQRLSEQIDAIMLEVRLVEVRPGRRSEIRADHYLSKKEAEKQGRRQGELDVEGFLDALARESIVSIGKGDGDVVESPSDEQIDALLGVSNAVRDQVLGEVDQLHGRGGDPKEQIDTGRRLSSEVS